MKRPRKTRARSKALLAAGTLAGASLIGVGGYLAGSKKLFAGDMVKRKARSIQTPKPPQVINAVRANYPKLNEAQIQRILAFIEQEERLTQAVFTPEERAITKNYTLSFEEQARRLGLSNITNANVDAMPTGEKRTWANGYLQVQKRRKLNPVKIDHVTPAETPPGSTRCSIM